VPVAGHTIELMSTAGRRSRMAGFQIAPSRPRLSGHRIPGMSIAGIWMASAFGLAFFGFAIAGVARWRESRRPIAAQYHRMVPRLRRPLVFRERKRGLQNDKLFNPYEGPYDGG